MISAWRYSHEAPTPEHIPIDDVADRVDPREGIIWVDTDEPDHPSLQKLLTALDVNEFAQEDVANAGQRTKLEHYSDHYHVVVYDCVLRGDELYARELDVVFGEGWLVTVHQPPEAGDPGDFPVADVRHRFEVQRSRRAQASVGLLLWALLDVIVDRYFAVTEAIDDLLDEAEDAVIDAIDERRSSGSQRVMQVFALGKALVRFRRAAVPLRDVTAEIVRREVSAVDESVIVYFQDLADHALRVSEFIESQRDVLSGLRDAELAAASNRLSRSQQKIAAWGALFIVATLITGLLGMNFRNAPELDWEEGFLAILGVILLISLPIYWYFKKRDWI